MYPPSHGRSRSGLRLIVRAEQRLLEQSSDRASDRASDRRRQKQLATNQSPTPAWGRFSQLPLIVVLFPGVNDWTHSLWRCCWNCTRCLQQDPVALFTTEQMMVELWRDTDWFVVALRAGRRVFFFLIAVFRPECRKGRFFVSVFFQDLTSSISWFELFYGFVQQLFTAVGTWSSCLLAACFLEWLRTRTRERLLFSGSRCFCFVFFLNIAALHHFSL